MEPNTRILIIYSTFGEGHVQAANAIKQQFISQGIQQIYMLDLMAEAHPYWNAVTRYCYLTSSALCPSLYGLSYNWSNRLEPDRMFNRWLHSFGKRKLREVIRRVQPDAVIHTFPYLAAEQLGLEMASPLPTFTVITDYVLHSRWVHPNTKHYFVATESLKCELIGAGVNGKRISVTGIPIRAAFENSFQQEDLFGKYKLDPSKKYVLIVAGAFGVLAHVRKLAAAILEDTDYDLILVCGRNQRLANRMAAQYGSHSRIHIFGYVNQLEELMGLSSCMLTKAGGITLTEALSMALPVIVYRPLPGQEKGNADRLSEAGAIQIADHVREVTNRLNQLQQPYHLQRMLHAMKSLYKSEAARSVASEVLQFTYSYAHGNQAYPTLSERKAIQTHGYP
ncbi:MGDG synthase family glycosyltransferase [Cohnella silvisoli]|uniref:UDP-N-acetylglucosamine 2-epimerase n=1 Tax=Cohnella silvisoli TaxID=2873699 RepID=A0ABV1KT06_9BACL|nr:UDP-N-acetylglucosamine 2-epimerase [Cohnella silvisoli]MCD9021481.1 UDP-N-acetylglucosamine 2-epimerase [Cohnella silvisoli]